MGLLARNGWVVDPDEDRGLHEAEPAGDGERRFGIDRDHGGQAGQHPGLDQMNPLHDATVDPAIDGKPQHSYAQR